MQWEQYRGTWSLWHKGKVLAEAAPVREMCRSIWMCQVTLFRSDARQTIHGDAVDAFAWCEAGVAEALVAAQAELAGLARERQDADGRAATAALDAAPPPVG